MSRTTLRRDPIAVARDLVGATLVVDAGTPDEVRARLVEVEAYLGADDPASHAHRGPTPRARIMFGDAGHLYVYLSYGVHQCANVVCGPAGVAGAVLLRAAEVVGGEAVVRRRRGEGVVASRLLSGPGNLCRGLGIGASDNGADVCATGRFALLAAEVPAPVEVGLRVGISRAAERPLRFGWRGHPAVSVSMTAKKKGTGAAAGP